MQVFAAVCFLFPLTDNQAKKKRKEKKKRWENQRGTSPDLVGNHKEKGQHINGVGLAARHARNGISAVMNPSQYGD